MSHPFGELVFHHLIRKKGLSQNKLAMGINQDPSVVSRMCTGRALTGPQARERVVQIIDWLRKQGALATVGEANDLLAAAKMTGLAEDIPAEVNLLHSLKAIDDTSQQPRPADIGHPASTIQARPPTNLPHHLTKFIGRERIMADIRLLLADPDKRLLTLTGVGGTGKTRLAQQIAAEMIDRFEDGVVYVPLAAVEDPSLVFSAIAQALGVTETGGQPLRETLKAHLVTREMLLVLDNFEHVMEAAPRISELMLAVPRLKVLVTSRQVLRLYGEYNFQVPPMSLPDLNHLPPLERLTEYEGVRLFVERAQAAKTDFVVSKENALVVAQICHRLEGLPLAIELTAARIRLLNPQAILTRLVKRLDVATAGAVDLPDRQKTLRGAIAWSYDLLNQVEQMLFRRMSVFASACTLDAAEAICNTDTATDADVLETIDSLANKSLLQPQHATNSIAEPRFAMLESIREYALEQLEQSGEADDLRRYHANYYLNLAGTAEPELAGPKQGAWLERLEAEHDDLRAALNYSLKIGAAETAARLGGSLWRYWDARGYLSEGRTWLERALAGPRLPPVVRAKALHGAGVLTADQGDYEPALKLFEEALALYQELNDRRGVADALNALGYVASDLGENGQAKKSFEESLELYEELGDRHGVGVVLHNLGTLASDLGDDMQAEQLYNKSLALARELGDKEGTAWALNSLGQSMLKKGAYERAQDMYEESLTICEELGNNMGIALCLEGLAGVFGATMQPERAARLFGAAAALRETTGSQLEPSYRTSYNNLVATARTHLDNATWDASWVAGQNMALEEACAYALSKDNATHS